MFLVVGKGLRALEILGEGWPNTSLVQILDLEDGLQILQEADISMVILEIPREHAGLQSGFPSIQSLRAVSAVVPIVVLSHMSTGDDRTKALNLGADRCIDASASNRELVAHIRAVLNRAGSESRT